MIGEVDREPQTSAGCVRPSRRIVAVAAILSCVAVILVGLAAGVGRRPAADDYRAGPAPDMLAQSSVWNALLTQQAYYRRTDRFTRDEAPLRDVNDQLRFVGFGGPYDVRVMTGDDFTTVCVGVQSESGARFYMKQVKRGSPEAHGSDTGVFVAESSDSEDLTTRCLASDDEPWRSKLRQWRIEEESAARNPWVCDRGESRQICGPDTAIQRQILDVGGDVGASYQREGAYRVESAISPVARPSGGPDEGRGAEDLTMSIAIADDGQTLCLGARGHGGTWYFLKIVRKSGFGVDGLMIYYGIGQSVGDLEPRCSRDVVANWSIYPSVVGWY